MKIITIHGRIISAEPDVVARLTEALMECEFLDSTGYGKEKKYFPLVRADSSYGTSLISIDEEPNKRYFPSEQAAQAAEEEENEEAEK